MATIPEAKNALEKFKMEAANEVGVTLNQGYNGDLTARQAGSIGGMMVKDMFPARSSDASRVSSPTPRDSHSFLLPLTRLR